MNVAMQTRFRAYPPTRQRPLKTANAKPSSYHHQPRAKLSKPRADPGRVPFTDPKYISRLWAQIRERSEAHEMASKSVADSATSAPAIGPRTKKDFVTKVLEPRSIFIDDTAASEEVFRHFGTEKPKNYEDLPGQKATVWTAVHDAMKIANEYQVMKNEDMNEDMFISLAQERLLHRNVFHFDERDEDRQWRSEFRLTQSAPCDDAKHWYCPPILDGNSAESERRMTYNRPDITYWVSMIGFNEKYRQKVRATTFTINYRATCPYFTIEFKNSADKKDEDVAINQMINSGSIALYNRFKLREKALTIKAKKELDADENAKGLWRPEDLSPIAHYGLTFTSEKFRVWIIEPNEPSSTPTTPIVSKPVTKASTRSNSRRTNRQTSVTAEPRSKSLASISSNSSGTSAPSKLPLPRPIPHRNKPSSISPKSEWQGCTVRELAAGSCTTQSGVEEITNWINEIHRWGMCVHALSCENDVKVVLKSMGVRVSEIGMARDGEIDRSTDE